MNEPAELRRIGVLSPFDEARATLDLWEKEYPQATYLAFIVHSPEEFEYYVTGKEEMPLTVSEIAGTFFRAAQLAAE